MEMLYSWDMILLFIQTAASITCTFVPVYFLPLYFQFVHQDAVFHSRVRLLPFICVLVTAVVLNGLLMSKTGYYKPWYMF